MKTDALTSYYEKIEKTLSGDAGSLISASEAEKTLREGMTMKSAQDTVRVHDPVNHPKHYTGHPSGIECIQITEHMGFCLGNAVKYIWRADLKNDAVEDLKKAAWYLDREIKRREKK